jgi:hypothetical protein
VVRNGYHQSREVLTAAGAIEVAMAAISNWFMMAVDQAGEAPMGARRERELIKG